MTGKPGRRSWTAFLKNVSGLEMSAATWATVTTREGSTVPQGRLHSGTQQLGQVCCGVAELDKLLEPNAGEQAKELLGVSGSGRPSLAAWTAYCLRHRSYDVLDRSSA